MCKARATRERFGFVGKLRVCAENSDFNGPWLLAKQSIAASDRSIAVHGGADATAGRRIKH
jgi:hypothetical protein